MKFAFTCDFSSETKINEVTDAFADEGFERYFADKFYDDSGVAIFVVLMCRDSDLKFKQRIRFSKKENVLYADLMLDYDVMRLANTSERKKIVAEKVLLELPPIIGKYKFIDFDLNRFSSDLKNWFIRRQWLIA